MNNQNLTKTISLVFVFVVATGAMGVLVADHFMNVVSDPKIISVVTSVLGFALSQIGFSQGASQVTNAIGVASDAITNAPMLPDVGPDVAPLAGN